MTRIDRRRLLTIGGVTLIGAALWPTTTAGAQVPSSTWTGRRSINGWPVLDVAETFRVEGSGLSVALAPAAAPVLLHVLRRYLYDVESTVHADEITGHTSDRRIAVDYESTYLSGSGISIRPLHHPRGAKDTYFPQEVATIRDIVADCDGVVVWGADLRPAAAAHFHIAFAPNSARYRRLLTKIRGWSDAPGEGAGTVAASGG